MRILFLSPYIPSPVRVRPSQWIRQLVRLGHHVHLVALSPPDDDGARADDLREVCGAVEVFDLSRGRTIANAVAAWPRAGVPLQLAYSHHRQAERRVAELAASGRFDLVHIEHLRGVALATRVGRIPVVYDAVDSISALFAAAAVRAPSRGARLRARLDLGRTRRFEARAPGAFSRVVVTSAREADTFADLAGETSRRRVSVVGNGVDTEHFRPSLGEPGGAVVLTGKLSYHANAAAALRLVERIMPLVWTARPGTPVVLAGKAPPDAVVALGRDPRVSVTGYVDDMRTVFGSAAVAACPLVYGAGIQNKVLEAMACGVPVVMGASAAGPLSGVSGQDYLVEDDDAGFAAAILRLIGDPIARARVGVAGRAYVARFHDWRDRARELVVAYEAALAAGAWTPRLLR